ncbi:MAG: BatA domain-containing protein [Planctomycetaceae bacterium]
MDFLTPIFAAIGVAAAAIPVVLHMLRRAPTQDMPFSIVRFLKPSQPKLTKRSNIEHWPLLLLRILALVLIGLAFARPFLREVIALDEADDVVQSVTILVDKSASMRRDGIYEKVQKTLRESIDELGDQDLLSVMMFSDATTTLLSREKWATATSGERAALVEGIVEGYEPDWMATNTGAAMRIAADELAQESKDRLNVRRRRLVLITDFQRGSNLDDLRTGNWPASVEVELKTIEPTKKGNVGVTFVKDRRADRTRVRIASAGDTVQQEFDLRPFDARGAPVGEAMKVTVAPGQRRSVILPAVDAKAKTAVVGVELKGDEHPFDNIIDLPELENPVVQVAHIGPAGLNNPESMRYYLQRVLDGNVERNVKLIDLLKGNGVVLPVPTDVKFVVATAAVPDALLDSVTEFLSRSGTLLMAPPSTDAVLSLSKFLPKDFEVKEAVVDDYAMLGQINFEHPLFSTFADARFADFSSIRFWKHRNLVFNEEDRQEGDWSVVAKFDAGTPAIVEVPVGDGGRVILFATGWHPTDSQWALSTRFPPLLTRILSLASPVQKDQVIQTVGDVIRPGQLVSSDNWTVTFPDGEVLSAADVAESHATDADATIVLTEPGRYIVNGKTDDGDYSVSLIAGLAAIESRTEMLPVGQLQVLGIGVDSPSEGQLEDAASADTNKVGQLNASELEKKQKWWRWLLLAGLGCLLLESLWASVIERRRATA